MIDPSVVQKTAALARLSTADDPDLARRLETIVSFFDQLDEVDTTGVEALRAPSGALSILRDDEPGVSLDLTVTRGLAPRFEGDYFAVPKTVE